MARAAQSRNGFFGFLADKKVTYHRAVGKERKERKSEAMAERKERLAVQELRAREKTAAAKIAAADRKIEQAEKKIESAGKKADKGGMSEARFEQMKARLQSEIEAQERHKAAAQGKNPSWGFGIYTGTGFTTRQVAHFKSKAAAETWARSHGVKGYAIKRAFAKNPTSHMRPASRRNEFGRGGKATGAGAGGAGGGAGAGSQGGRSSTDVRSPTRTSTSTEAETTGNITVTGGAGAGANTTVHISKSNPLFRPVAALLRKKGKKIRRNPAADAESLSKKFHGRTATTQRRIVEPMHVHKHLMEVGDLVRLVIDTPTGIVAVLNFNTSDPKKIVRLASSEKDPKTGKIVGKQLYLRGGDQEVNLKGLKMDSPLWIRDLMELGRLHRFKKGDPPLIVDGERVKGSITYRTRKGMDDFKLIDYWHKAGEESEKKIGEAARSLVLYDYPNKKIMFGGGNYHLEEPGIIN